MSGSQTAGGSSPHPGSLGAAWLRWVSGLGSCHFTSRDPTSVEVSWSLKILCWPLPTVSPGESALQQFCFIISCRIIFILGPEFMHLDSTAKSVHCFAEQPCFCVAEVALWPSHQTAGRCMVEWWVKRVYLRRTWSRRSFWMRTTTLKLMTKTLLCSNLHVLLSSMVSHSFSSLNYNSCSLQKLRSDVFMLCRVLVIWFAESSVRCACERASFIYISTSVFFCYPDKVQPACLPTFNQQFPAGTQCWTSGFGTTEEGSRKLRHGVIQ